VRLSRFSERSPRVSHSLIDELKADRRSTDGLSIIPANVVQEPNANITAPRAPVLPIAS